MVTSVRAVVAICPARPESLARYFDDPWPLAYPIHAATSRDDGVARGFWHATGDEVVPWGDTFALYSRARQPKRLSVVMGGHHRSLQHDPAVQAQTAAATGKVGVLRRDPMAMLPFCGYNMGDYFRHWLQMRRRIANPPRIFNVNWFRKDAEGKFLWPGYSENMRVLKWIVDRCRGQANANEDVLGWVPDAHDFDLDGLEGFDAARLQQAQSTDAEEWRRDFKRGYF